MNYSIKLINLLVLLFNMSYLPSVDNLTKYNDNREDFHKLYHLIKTIIGLIVIEKLPIPSNTINLFVEKGIKRNVFSIKYEIDQTNKQNLSIDLNFEIKTDKISKNIQNLNQFLLFLISNELISDFLVTFKDYLDTIMKKGEYEDILDNLFKKTDKIIYDVFSDLFKNLIELNGYNISLFNHIKIEKFKKGNKNQYNYDKINPYTLLLSMFINENPIEDQKIQTILRFEIFELFELIYFGFVENYDNYINYLGIENDSYRSNFVLLNHKHSIYDFIKITPLIRYSDAKLNQKLLESYSYSLKRNDISKIILNGRFFFRYISNNNPFNSKYNKLRERFELMHLEILEVRKKSTLPEDDPFFDYFGLILNQFVIGEITLEPYSVDKVSIRIQLTINDIDKLDDRDNTTAYSIFKIQKTILISELIKWRVYIYKIYRYFLSIFRTYPQHSTIIGCSDLLYYYNLYNHFPILKKYRIPLVQNIGDILDKIHSNEDIITYKLIREGLSNESKKGLYGGFKSVSLELQKEYSEFLSYVGETKEFLKTLGMDFGLIDINKWKNNEKDPFIERMPKYNTPNFDITENTKYFNRFYLKKLVNFCISKGFLYDINYFMENYIKIRKIESRIIEVYDDIKSLNNISNIYSILTDDYDPKVEQYFILFPFERYSVSNFKEEDMIGFHTGVNILFRESSTPKIIVAIKLNNTPFNQLELAEFKKVFNKYATNIHFENDHSIIVLNDIEMKKIDEIFSNENVRIDFGNNLRRTYSQIYEKEKEEYKKNQIWLDDETREKYFDEYHIVEI